MRYLPLLIIAACASGPDRAEQLEACQLISKSGDALAECLVLKFSWRADSAGPAKYQWQHYLDSLRREHEQQVAALLAEQQRVRDSAARIEAARREAMFVVERRVDSTYRACMQPAVDALVNMNEQRYREIQRRCGETRTVARRRAGLREREEP